MPCSGREGMKGGGGGGHLQSGYFLRDAAASVACRPGVLASINGEGEKAAGRAAQPLAAATDARRRASGIPCLISSPLYSHVTRRAGGTRETRKGHVSASAANFPARARAARASTAGTNFGGGDPTWPATFASQRSLLDGKIPPP